MKKLVRLMGVILALLMLVGMFAGCHKKNEIAFKIGNQEYTSAMYSCALFFSVTEAKSAINTFVSENKGDTTNIIYENYKFDAEGNVSATGTVSYEDYARNSAINQLKMFAAVSEKVAAEKLTMSEDYIRSAELDAEAFWYVGCSYSTYYNIETAYQNNPTSLQAQLAQYVPYAYYLEQNGVLFDTFKQYTVNQYRYNYYFETIYGEGGSKEVPENELKDYIKNNYLIADAIVMSIVDDENKALSEDKLNELIELGESYVERLEKGESFETIYNEYQEKLEEDSKKEEDDKKDDTSTDDTSTDDSDDDTTNKEETDKEEKFTPAEYTGIFSDNEDDTYYEDLKDLKAGEVLMKKYEDLSAYVIFQKGDIEAEEFWYENRDNTEYFSSPIIYQIKGDSHKKMIEDFAKTLTITEDASATKPFKVKKIKTEAAQ